MPLDNGQNESKLLDGIVSPNRRKMLKILGLGGAVSLAGCMGGSGGTQENNSGGKTPLESELTAAIGVLPPDLNWNIYGTNFKWGLARDLWHVARPRYDLFLKEWTYDPEKQVVRYVLPEGITYWNGEPLTAETGYIQGEINRLQNPEASSLADVRKTGTYSLEFEYKKPQNPTILRGDQPVRFFATPPSVFTPWLEKFQDATTKKERNQLTKDLGNFTISTKQLIDEGLGNHPYELVEANNREMVHEVRTDHPWYVEDQVKTYRKRVIKEVNQLILKQDKLDIGGGLLSKSFSGPEHLKNIIKNPSIHTRKIGLNHLNKHLKKRAVRRALAHLFDLRYIAQNTSTWNEPLQNQSGTGPVANEWLGEEFIEKLIDYPVKADPKRATALLEGAGYTKRGGKWTGPDGDPVSFDVIAINWTGFKKSARTVNAQLKQFGFDTSFVSVGSGVYSKRIRNQMDYDITYYFHNNLISHPLSYYRLGNVAGMRLAPLESYADKIPKWLEAGKEYSPFNGMPLTPTIPKQVGAKSVNGDGRKLNLWKLVQETRSAPTREKTVENLRLLARFWNYSLPDIDAIKNIGGFWGDVENFDMPVDKDDKLQMYAESHVALHQGMIKYKYE